MLNLDTHILLFAAAGDLSAKERRLLVADPRWGISGIVLWEISKLAALGRISIDLDSPILKELIRRLTVWPITAEVARQSTRLDIRSDPADELIVATSIVFNVSLVTRDKKLLRSKITPFPFR